MKYYHDPGWPGKLDQVSRERDACGVGFVASLNRHKNKVILDLARVAVGNLVHRGAVSADGLTGDGAGILTQIPHAFFRRELAQHGLTLEQDEDLAIGVLFLPRGEGPRTACLKIVEAALSQGGINLLGYRQVPVNLKALGAKAQASCPDIRQVLMSRTPQVSGVAFERLLYLTRKRIEARIVQSQLGPFYIPSFSHRTIVYKGLMLSSQLGNFYPDLLSDDYVTSLAVFHQRYSSNTFPSWPLAQPFRFLGHNGEINTLQGNINWMRAREPELQSLLWQGDLAELLPVIQAGGSDSATLDNAFEMLVMSGRDPIEAIMMMVPEAADSALDPQLRAFYDYHAPLLEPWDGPAALVFSDGRVAAAALDRNGLRPLRYYITTDGLVIVGSEAGIVPLPPDRILEKGRLGPGKILAVDTQTGKLLRDQEVKAVYAGRRPYRDWVERHTRKAPVLGFSPLPQPFPQAFALQKIFGYGKEDVELIFPPMLEGKEPGGSMGDDTPLACLSQKPQLLYNYFRQRFAQVTNPPIDSLRERNVFSLTTHLGPRGSLLADRTDQDWLVRFASPILSSAEFDWLLQLDTHDPRCAHHVLAARFPATAGAEALEPAMEQLCSQAEAAVKEGRTILVLSDRDVGLNWAPIPMLLLTGAIHHRLIQAGCRLQASLVCDCGEVREDHHFACLIGYGANLIHPYLAYDTVCQVARNTDSAIDQALTNYKGFVEKALLKIMSKMGISATSSYRGAQIFEIIGLKGDVVERAFTGTAARIHAVGLAEIAQDVLRFHGAANARDPVLEDQGAYRVRKDGEAHAFNPEVVRALHQAVKDQSFESFSHYTALVEQGPAITLRDLLAWREAESPLPTEEVEPAAEIARRFCVSGMSFGSLSREAHETIAIAMNRLGGKSNSGEGGEDEVRFYPYATDRPDRSVAAWFPRQGDWSNSAIKQVASGRFGVTPEYLVSARQIEIKMVQGSKPGEGGQIPGNKVDEEIARIRHTIPGVPLISPPPHHDIYSIEDLAQLIYDLKRVNRLATVAVKLVSEAGVGTVAAGVTKGYADTIQISGHEGGTGASPLSSTKHSGIPWELGLAETQQTLVANDLRGRVKLRVDGGLKTGRDVVMAALLGAEEFGFGTAALVALGCVMARQCHLNTCPTGIATQDETLRRKFPGTPERLITFMLLMAEQVRTILARLGYRSLDDIIGRVDLLKPRDHLRLPKGNRCDLAALREDADPGFTKPRRRVEPSNDRPEPPPLDEQIWLDCREVIRTARPAVLTYPNSHSNGGTGVSPIQAQAKACGYPNSTLNATRRYPITNRERTVGARLSGEIARLHRGRGLPEGTVEIFFQGSSGQSFGAFLHRGVRLILAGEAQDYVGKGMFGGEIIIRPPSGFSGQTQENVIMGNTVMYGATGGRLYAAGKAGERLAVRNSGGLMVVEGCGDHGCEYMTNGVVVLLGETGRNFGAGMSGGVAFVLDVEGGFEGRYNPGMVRIERLSHDIDANLIRELIERHTRLTESPHGSEVLSHWDQLLAKFWKVVPQPNATLQTAQEQDTELLALAALHDLWVASL
ncbi:MAG: glutamate synthase large subunit [Desulfobaccales bacterium]